MSSDESGLPDGVAVEYNPQDDEPTSRAERVRRDHEAELMDFESVTGVGVGQNVLGEDAILVYLRDTSEVPKLPKQIEGMDVVTQVTGEIDAY